MKKAVIIGASSGIGRALAREMSAAGYELGLAARREEMLRELQQELPNPSVVRTIDVTADDARERLADLLAEMGEVDVVVVNSGIGITNWKLRWDRERDVIGVNVEGFAAMANTAWHYFEKLGRGHLVGISSVAKHRGQGHIPAYPASKAFVSNYMEGLRIQSHKRKLNIAVTDVRPGFVDTPMTEGQKGMFWVAGVEEAARQIFRAIEKRKKRAYVTRRWALLGGVLTVLPEWIYRKF